MIASQLPRIVLAGWIGLSSVALAHSAPARQAESEPAGDAAQSRRRAVETGLVTRLYVEGHLATLEERMQSLRVPGVSIAVIHDGALDWARGYGVRDAETREPVGTQTLFQAGSISKPVAALLAVRLAQDGRLDLDAPIAEALRSWRLPDTRYDDELPLTARHLLSHTGGVTVHGFAGYGTYEEVPTLHQVLDGSAPANSSPITLDRAPMVGVRYSGGGTSILQQAVIDLSGSTFPALAQRLVLEPLGMSRSTYAQPLPVLDWPDHCAGHEENGVVQTGRFRVHPEMEAAGLWTTASDLASFAMDLQASLAGSESGVLSPAMAREMLTPVADNAALGLFIAEFGGERWFQHGGSNIGFKNQLYASFEGGRGVVVMTNGENGGTLMQEVIAGVARVYGWPGWEGFHGRALEAGSSNPERIPARMGRYELSPDHVLYVEAQGATLSARAFPEAAVRLIPLADGSFLPLGTDRRLRFGAGDRPDHLVLASSTGAGERHARRLTSEERWPVDDLLAGLVEDAVDFYREVHAENPADPMVALGRLHELCKALLIEEQRPLGLALARLTAELYPEAQASWFTLGSALLLDGTRAEARQAFERCLALGGPDAASDRSSMNWVERNSHSLIQHLAGAANSR